MAAVPLLKCLRTRTHSVYLIISQYQTMRYLIQYICQNFANFKRNNVLSIVMGFVYLIEALSYSSNKQENFGILSDMAMCGLKVDRSNCKL